MLKRMYIVLSLLSLVTIVHGMDETVGKRSAGDFFNHTLNAVLGKVEDEVAMHAGTITTIENELGVVADQLEQKVSSLDPKMVWNALVVCGAVCGAVEGCKWAYNRYGKKSNLVLDSHLLGQGTQVAQAANDADKIGTFVSKQQIDALVEAKWNELVTSSTISSLTQAVETTARRVTTLEGQVKGLGIIVNGDAATKKTGIVTSHEVLANRIAALENIKPAASSSSVKQKGKLAATIGGLFKKNVEHKDAGDGHSHGDAMSAGHDEDEDHHATSVTLHALGDQNKDKKEEDDDRL